MPAQNVRSNTALQFAAAFAALLALAAFVEWKTSLLSFAYREVTTDWVQPEGEFSASAQDIERAMRQYARTSPALAKAVATEWEAIVSKTTPERSAFRLSGASSDGRPMSVAAVFQGRNMMGNMICFEQDGVARVFVEHPSSANHKEFLNPGFNHFIPFRLSKEEAARGCSAALGEPKVTGNTPTTG